MVAFIVKMYYLLLLTEILLIPFINSSDSPSLAGFYTDGLNEAIDKIEIVYPEKVSKDGSRISYYLPHFYDMDSVDSRQRRSGHARDRREDAVHFSVPIDGKQTHLEMWPNADFISPGLVIERRDARDIDNVNKATISQVSSKQCHYNGRIVGKPESTVALSTCYGLVGYIRVPDGEEYMIEPVKDFKPEPNKEHPHIIYKRSMIKEKQTSGTNCLTKGRAKEALEERMKWEAIYGDQVRKEVTGINMNEVVRGKNEPAELPLVETSRYTANNPNSVDNLNNINKFDSKVLQNKLNFNGQGETHRENSDKEMMNKYTSIGDKQKSLSDNKNMDESFRLVQPVPPNKLDSSILYKQNHRIKRESDNYGHIVKRDLKTEEEEQPKLANDNSDDSDNKGKSVCDKVPNRNSEHSDNQVNKLQNNGESKREILSDNGRKAFISPKLDSSTISDSSKNGEMFLNKQDQDSVDQEQNGQSSAKEKDTQSYCGSNLQTKPTNSQEKINERLNTVKDHKKRNVHLDTSDKSWQINTDANSITFKQNKAYDKRSQMETDKLPSDTASANKNTDGIDENEKYTESARLQANNVKEESAPKSDKFESKIYDLFNDQKPKIKKEISDQLHEINLNPSPQDKNPLYENVHQTSHKIATDISKIPILSDYNKNQNPVDKDLPSDLSSAGYSETAKQSEELNPNSAEEIVINIKIPEGSDYKSNVLCSSGKERYNNLDIHPAQTLHGNENKRVIADSDVLDSKKSKLSVDKEHAIDMEGYESQHFDVKSNKNVQSKIKRHDNTIHLKLESEPEYNNAEYINSKSGLFCQGKHCLEIKPVMLNGSDSNSPGVNNNTNADNTKSKAIGKRFAPWEDEDCTTTTTGRPHLCFDIYSKIFNLELMIVVDHKVLRMHDDDDIENFILTIMNMVSTNFFDKSIKINLNVVLVRFLLLTTCIKELDSDRFNPEELLENFCTWQDLINPSRDSHPHHHDLAIFVTRLDKCEGKVMGVTYMTSVCRPDKACLVCVDEGLLLANTITHQIGHSLGAEHDDGESLGCSSTSNQNINFHMAPTIREASSGWSACSSDAIIQFLKTQGSWCLADIPSEIQHHFPFILPGQIYSAAQQCKLNYHMTSIPCSVGSFCERLYCQVTDKICASKGDPPADGTFCAADMWCFHKQCVHTGRRPGAVNGEWGPWTEWSDCTRSCGGGVSTSFRICNNPKPENGGRFCIGDRIRHRMCAINPCQGISESFRDLQCKKTEDRPFKGRHYNWVQYHSYFLNIECSLVCQNRKGEVVMRSPVVADGTPCKPGTRNVCIQGICRNVGCDWGIDSKAKEDACGICHGNATECRIIQGVFDEPCIKKGLVEFLRIPKRSGMIFVREINPSSNIIVVSGAINRVFYLNGLGSEDSMPGDVAFGGTHGVYEVRSSMERIFIRGPTTEDLIFYVLFREQNTGIHFQYAIPEVDHTYVPRYLWQFTDWDPCTVPCSGGAQRAHAKCVEDRGGVVDDQYCTETTRPMDVIRPCNDFPCHAKWWVSVWSDCICTGVSSVMFRSVLCMRTRDETGSRAEIVKESECSSQTKPPAQKPCNVSEFDSDCVKRSVNDGDKLGHRKYIRRGVSPKIAYNSLSSDELYDLSSQEQDIIEGKDKFSVKNQRKPIKPQGSKSDNTKDDTNKLKTKADKDTSDSDQNNAELVKDKNSEASLTKTKGIKEFKNKVKDDDVPLGSDKGKQVAKFAMKNGASLHGGSNTMKNIGKARQTDDKGTAGAAESKEQCETTTAGACPTQGPDTTESSTCKLTNPVHPHRKTTCCKTSPRRRLNTKTTEITTVRPAVVKMDEVNMNQFQLTLVPLDFPNKKKLPQSDPEFINLGNIGQFGVGDEYNATILSGQEAIDFLDYARNNASEEPVILHEEMHNE